MKFGVILSLTLLLLATSILSFETPPPSGVKDLYTARLWALDSCISSFKKDVQSKNGNRWKHDFEACRYSYKMVEPIVAYYYPYAEIRINGPAVFEVEPSDFSEINYPTGFQVLEEQIFSETEGDKTIVLIKQLDYLSGYVHLLQKESGQLNISAATLFDICKTGLYAMASKGLSGFDSPVALHGIKEATFTLDAVRLWLDANGTMNDDLKRAISVCSKSLNEKPSDFEHFDRAVFLSKDFNRLMKALYQCQQQFGIPFIEQRSAVRTNVVSFLAKDAFDPLFFADDSTLKYNAAQIELGKMLFNEPALSLSGRSCASCHRPEKAYTDGLIKNTSLQRDEMIFRNTPTIINAALQPFLFYDVRVSSLEEQAHQVLQNKDEMDGNIEKAIVTLQKDRHYPARFSNAFPEDARPITQRNIIAAIATFERSLVKMNAPFDQYMRGDTAALNPMELKGFNLFMGKAKCGTCHYMPLFNGVVPPFYKKEDTEIIGVTATSDNTHPVLDADPGAYNYFHNDIKKHAFKTPTLRNIALTAPYMHNGAFSTLEKVIDFYDKGGAVGIGIRLENQTLPSDKLHLDPIEKKALVAFLKTLTDNQTN